MLEFGSEIDWAKLSLGFILGYLISWAYFFITLPIFIYWFGKINGSIINYGISWIIWTLITIAPELISKENGSQYDY